MSTRVPSRVLQVNNIDLRLQANYQHITKAKDTIQDNK